MFRSRRLTSTFVVLSVLLAAPVARAADVETAEVDQTGWWSTDQGPQEMIPPEVPVAPPPNVLPGQVPQGAIGVGAQVGQTDKVAAVGILLPTGRGGSITELILKIREVDDASVNPGAQTAQVRACPITEFWITTENGPIASAPRADCGRATAGGERSSEGEWTFDLTQLGAVWTAPDALVQYGVLLEPAPAEAPQSFQISYASSSARVTFAGTPGTEVVEAPLEVPPPVVVDPPLPDNAPPIEATLPAVAPAAPPPPTQAPPPVAAPAGPPTAQALPIATREGDFWNLPIPYAVLGIGLIGLLALCSLVLGQDSEVGTGRRRREGPLARALAHRAEQDGDT